MERNRDSRIATASMETVLPRRRRKMTTRRDSNEVHGEKELQETVTLRDDERLQKKDRDREFLKRRRIASYAQQQRRGGEIYRENDSTDVSDEEFCEEEEDVRIHYLNRMNQPSPQSSSFSNGQRTIRTLRSSPVLKASVDETIGVPIPRRARSTLTKRLHEYDHVTSGSLGEHPTCWKFLPSSASANVIDAAGVYPGSSDPYTKTYVKSVEPRVPGSKSSYNSGLSSLIQNDIEIEVVEALFDLMKQSQSLSPSQFSKNTADEALKKSGELEYNLSSARIGKSVKVDGEAVMDNSIEVMKKEKRIQKEKFPKEFSAVSGEGFLNEGKILSPKPKEGKSPSYVKLNALEVHDKMAAKTNYAAVVIETMKDVELGIDLAGPPPLPPSPEKNVLADTSPVPKFMAQHVRKISKTISRECSLAVANQSQEQEIEATSSNQLPKFDLENFNHKESEAGRIQLQHQVHKEKNNEVQTSLLPYQISLSGWPGVLPHAGYRPPMPVVLPIDGNARFPAASQPPKYKFSQPRLKRSATHQFIAKNILYIQQLITKSLLPGSTGAATFHGTLPFNLNQVQRLILPNPSQGDNKVGHNLATNSTGDGIYKSSVKNKQTTLQNGQDRANNFLHAPAFIFPLTHHQTSIMATAKLSGTPQSSSAGNNISLPTCSASASSVSLPLPVEICASRFSIPNFPLNEVAPYMAMLQNNALPIPISRTSIPHMRGHQSPPMPIFNSSFYSSQLLNAPQTQKLSLLSHTQGQAGTKISDHNFSPSAAAHSQLQLDKQEHVQSLSSAKSDANIGRKSCALFSDGLAPHSVTPNVGLNCSFPVQERDLGTPSSMGAVGNRHLGSKDRLELVPQAFAMRYGSNASAGPAINLASMAQGSTILQMLPEMNWNGYQMPKERGSLSASEGKGAIASTLMDDGIKGYMGQGQTYGGQSSKSYKSRGADIPTSVMESSTVDGLACSLNLVPSASTAIQQPWLSSSVSHTFGIPGILPNLHQHEQQSIQLQRLYFLQTQQTGTANAKASTATSMPGSFLPGSFPSNHPGYSQVSFQPHEPSYSLNCQNFHRSAPMGSSQSLNSVVNNHQEKSFYGDSNISIGTKSISATSSKDHIMTNNQPKAEIGPTSDLSISKNICVSQRTSSSGGNAESKMPALLSQHTDSSPNGPSQKSSPTCGRNVPSVLSTCSSQLSELKY